jgi:hypothetical protein
MMAPISCRGWGVARIFMPLYKTTVMSSTLIDSVKSDFTDILLSKFPALLGETEGSIQQALHGAIPLILTDIVHKAYYPQGIGRIGTLARQAATSDFFGQLHELSMDSGGLMAGSFLMSKGADFSKSLLGSRVDAVIDEISRYSGVGVPSAIFITGIACFAALDAIGRHIGRNADGNGLAVWLKAQLESIIRATPPGLEVKQALGIDYYPWERRVGARKSSFVYYFLSILILAVILLLFFRSRQHTDLSIRTGAADSTVTAAAPDSAAPDSAAAGSPPATVKIDTASSRQTTQRRHKRH